MIFGLSLNLVLTGILSISSAMGIAPGVQADMTPKTDVASQVAAATSVQQSSVLAPAVVVSAPSGVSLTFERAGVGSIAKPTPPPPPAPVVPASDPSNPPTATPSSSSTPSTPATPADPADANLGAPTYDVATTIKAAKSEIGKSFPTGFGNPGECINAAHRWVIAGGGPWTGAGTPINNYVGAKEVKNIKDALPGDVIQYYDTNHPNDWVDGVHTVLVVGNNGDGTLDIIQANAPAGSGLVSEVTKWTPHPPAPLIYKIFRF